MSDDPQPDLSPLIERQRRLLSDMGGIRDDLTVLTAIARRQDRAPSALLTEVRATHSQHSRVAYRVRDLEARGV